MCGYCPYCDPGAITQGGPPSEWELPAGSDAAPPRYSPITSSPGELHTGLINPEEFMTVGVDRFELYLFNRCHYQVCSPAAWSTRAITQGGPPSEWELPAGSDAAPPRYSPTSSPGELHTGEKNNLRSTLLFFEIRTAPALDTALKLRVRVNCKHRKVFSMDNKVTEEELDYVADNISPRQSRRLLRKLGLKDVTIDQVFHDFEKDGSREQLYQGLRKCKEKKGSSFTLECGRCVTETVSPGSPHHSLLQSWIVTKHYHPLARHLPERTATKERLAQQSQIQGSQDRQRPPGGQRDSPSLDPELDSDERGMDSVPFGTAFFALPQRHLAVVRGSTVSLAVIEVTDGNHDMLSLTS
ncbi:RIPK1 [Branchiostoma lanceolatum]|uniref:RIPK1 protein n=1 Tax=Branchiostoma lanceolatum TaxID=7740 RepID=A0A8J9YN72_BRALA|nr:RIPK1 [Branchiostoma lanceolatum]